MNKKIQVKVSLDSKFQAYINTKGANTVSYCTLIAEVMEQPHASELFREDYELLKDEMTSEAFDAFVLEECKAFVKRKMNEFDLARRVFKMS